MAKSGTHFHFQQFSIAHDRCTMKVGTDGVLLGAWTNVDNATTLLDIGTGTGVIAIMLAQRTRPDAQIDAVEIEEQDARQAKENVLHSPWPEKVKVYCSSVQSFTPDKTYDVIVSNPPYFINSWIPPEKRRVEARHTVLLSFADLLSASLRLLSPKGTLNVILPYTEGLQFIEQAETVGLHCTRQTSFRTRKEKPIERWLLEFSKHPSAPNQEEVLLYEKDLHWSDSYKKLTGDFYLKR